MGYQNTFTDSFAQDHLGQIFSSPTTEGTAEKRGRSQFFSQALLLSCTFPSKRLAKRDLLKAELIHEQLHYRLLLGMAPMNLAFWVEIIAYLELMEFLVNRKADGNLLVVNREEFPNFLTNYRLLPTKDELYPYQVFIEGLTLNLMRSFEVGRKYLTKMIDRYEESARNYLHSQAFLLFGGFLDKIETNKEVSSSNSLLTNPRVLLLWYNHLCQSIWERQLIRSDLNGEDLDLVCPQTLAQLRECFSSELHRFLYTLKDTPIEIGRTIGEAYKAGLIFNSFQEWGKIFAAVQKAVGEREHSIPGFHTLYLALSEALGINFASQVRHLPLADKEIKNVNWERLETPLAYIVQSLPAFFVDGYYLILPKAPSLLLEEKLLEEKKGVKAYMQTWLWFSFFKAIENWVIKGKSLACPIYQNLYMVLKRCPFHKEKALSEQFCVHERTRLNVKELLKECRFWNFIQDVFSFVHQIRIQPGS